MTWIAVLMIVAASTRSYHRTSADSTTPANRYTAIASLNWQAGSATIRRGVISPCASQVWVLSSLAKLMNVCCSKEVCQNSLSAVCL